MGSQHSSVIAIDPGARTGWAVFWAGKLSAAGAIRMISIHELPDVPFRPAIVVVEQPVIYPVGTSNVDPNDLITLALLAGRIVGAYQTRSPGVDTTLVKPRTWKGTVPKKIHNARVLGALTDEERAVLPRRPRAKGFDHNMIDAVGLGLWQLRKEGQRQ